MPPPLPIVPAVPFVLDVRDCHTQRRLGLITEQLYAGDGTMAAVTLALTYPGIVIARQPNTASIFPGSLVGVLGDATIIIVSGTTNPQQWALQAMFGVEGQTDYGLWSTLRLWRDASYALTGRVESTSSVPTGPVILVGHSYGGAVASITAVRYAIGRPDRDIQILTYGSPAPGDSRLTGYLSRIRGAHLVNTDDPIPFLPPGREELSGLSALIPSPVRQRWLTYHRESGRQGLTTTGVRVDSPDSGNLYGVIYRLMVQAVSFQVPAAIYSHNMAEYLRRLVCPAEVALPPSPPVIAKGGVKVGGSAVMKAGTLMTGSGGIALGGTAGIEGPYYLTGSGGIALGGTAGKVSYVMTGSGGIALGGTAGIEGPYYLTGSGGIALGGTAGIEQFIPI